MPKRAASSIASPTTSAAPGTENQPGWTSVRAYEAPVTCSEVRDGARRVTSER